VEEVDGEEEVIVFILELLGEASLCCICLCLGLMLLTCNRSLLHVTLFSGLDDFLSPKFSFPSYSTSFSNIGTSLVLLDALGNRKGLG